MPEVPQQRSVTRRRVLKDGKIIIHPPSGTLDVKIRDLSETGAKLEIPAATTLPEKFALIIVAEGVVTPTEVMWRRGDLVGVHFCGETKKVALRRI